MSRMLVGMAVCVAAVSACATTAQPTDVPALRRQVVETEKAFARTMADRDYSGFISFLSEDAVFFSGDRVLRGWREVAEKWKAYYDVSAAPFSWEPEEVEVLASGTLALSSGPVRSSEGAVVGRFTSIWRLEAPGTWKIVFDKGSEVCRADD